ncbi:SPOR domain-containing protein [Loktanella sp. DJP18]|uniref:SPOR domain-containing protein n=1 Tax=Loktanella sp. DJP18 TaxID=3409788 RepID=UPI003BB8048A
MAVHDEAYAPGRLADVAGRYTQYAGAAVSLSLMIGVAVWGTKTIMRDVSGVPVVRAAQGDMRVAPDDPGGDVADHRGLAVNTVAGSGEAAAPEGSVTLAPRTVDLAAEDLDTAPLAAATPDAVVAASADAPAAVTTPTGPMNADDILALADQISSGVAPMAALEDMEDGSSPVTTLDGEKVDATEIMNIDAEDPIALALAEAMASDVAEPSQIAAPTGSIRSVIRPTARPLRATPAVATAADLTPAPVQVAAVVAEEPALPSVAVMTDELPVGTKLVQLGAFPTPEDAAQEWGKLQTRFGDLLADKGQVIQQASSGGATFYRLRASGFQELADARAFCDVMDAGRAACTPVVVR